MTSSIRIIHSLLRHFGRADWIRLGIRERLISKISPPTEAMEFNTEFGPHNRLYQGRLDNLIDWRVFFFGAHEYKELQFLKSIANPKGTLLDIGMNVGHHTLYLSDHFKKVLGFEPYHPLAESARQKILSNKIENVEIFELGLGSTDTQLQYIPAKGSNMGVGSFEKSPDIGANAIILNVANGDNLLKDHRIAPISMIKIDVEGMERDVITGLHKTITEHRPIIYLEFSEKTRESYQDFQDFQSDFPPNYKFYRLCCNQPRLLILNQKKCHTELFRDLKFTGNILAVPALKNEAACLPPFA